MLYVRKKRLLISADTFFPLFLSDTWSNVPENNASAKIRNGLTIKVTPKAQEGRGPSLWCHKPGFRTKGRWRVSAVLVIYSQWVSVSGVPELHFALRGVPVN